MSRRDGLILAAILLMYLAAGVVALVMGDATDRQTLIVYATGATVIWYTWETVRLRVVAAEQLRASEQQRDVMLQQLAQQIRPCVVVSEADAPLGLRNIGTGPALNMRVSPARVETPPDATHGEVVMRFDPEVIPYLAPDARSFLNVTATVAGVVQRSDYFAKSHLQPQQAQHRIVIAVSYQDSEGRDYTLEHEIGPHYLRLLGGGGAAPVRVSDS